MTRRLATFLIEGRSLPVLRESHVQRQASAGRRRLTDVVPYVDAERLISLVEHAPDLALVDFTATWCPPCRMLGPHVDAIAREFQNTLTVVKVDVDDQPGLAARFGVLSVPTLIFFRDGRAVDRIVGALPPAPLRARVKELQRS
jgi:thioredoxin